MISPRGSGAISGAQFQVHITPEDVATGEGIDERSNAAHRLFETWNDPEQKFRPANRHSDRMVPNTTVHAGRPVARQDLPEELHHVTTNLPGIQSTGAILSSAPSGGLGGSHKRLVSMTTDPDIARQLEDDVRDFATVAHTRSPEAAMDFYHRKYEEHGMTGFEHMQRMYDSRMSDENPNFGDLASSLASHYHSARARQGKGRHPVILADLGRDSSPWWDVHPNHVGTVTVPTSSLPHNALVTSFDLHDPTGLEEVRVHADIPIHHERAA